MARFWGEMFCSFEVPIVHSFRFDELFVAWFVFSFPVRHRTPHQDLHGDLGCFVSYPSEWCLCWLVAHDTKAFDVIGPSNKNSQKNIIIILLIVQKSWTTRNVFKTMVNNGDNYISAGFFRILPSTALRIWWLFSFIAILLLDRNRKNPSRRFWIVLGQLGEDFWFLRLANFL